MIAIRTVPEQVSKNAADIKELKDSFVGGADIDKINFSDVDLSDDPDFERTLPSSSMALTDVQEEQAIILLKKFIKKGYIVASGAYQKLIACGYSGDNEDELMATFAFINIHISSLYIEITY